MEKLLKFMFTGYQVTTLWQYQGVKLINGLTLNDIVHVPQQLLIMYVCFVSDRRSTSVKYVNGYVGSVTLLRCYI